MNVKEMCGQIDYLVSVKTNLLLYLQEYSPDEITIEYDDGSFCAEWANIHLWKLQAMELY